MACVITNNRLKVCPGCEFWQVGCRFGQTQKSFWWDHNQRFSVVANHLEYMLWNYRGFLYILSCSFWCYKICQPVSLTNGSTALVLWHSLRSCSRPQSRGLSPNCLLAAKNAPSCTRNVRMLRHRIRVEATSPDRCCEPISLKKHVLISIWIFETIFKDYSYITL